MSFSYKFLRRIQFHMLATSECGQHVDTALNVNTGLNPRQPVVIEIQPNVYNNYLSQTAGVNLYSLG
jgi:hypothetical protein